MLKRKKTRRERAKSLAQMNSSVKKPVDIEDQVLTEKKIRENKSKKKN